MPTYYFVAKSLKGEEKRDKLEAKNERELAKILREKGFILLRAEIEEKKKPEIFKISLPFFNRVSLVEKLMFTRNLRVMISAGVPLTRAIYTIAEVVKTKRFKKVLFEIAQKIEKGESFSKSLSYFPSIFSELFVSCIKTGEESGTLEESLEILTEQKTNVIYVPRRSVSGSGDSYTAEILTNDGPKEVSIKVGLRGDSEIEVISGLSPGDQLILGEL